MAAQRTLPVKQITLNMALAVDSISFDAVRVALNLVANMQRLEMTARFFIQRLEQSGISEQRRQPVSEINYQALREVAERAIPAMERLLMLPADDDLLSEQELKDYGVDIDALNAFKFMTGPENVLVLLDELDKWKQESSAWQAVAEKQLALATNAEQKIAELESLTAPKLPQPAPVSVPEVVGWEDVPEEITEDDIALASAWAHGFNQCRAAMLKSFGHSEQLDEVGSWNNHLNTPTAQTGNHTEQNLDMVDHFGDATQKAMLHGSEPETDNTNQQFESLSRGDK